MSRSVLQLLHASMEIDEHVKETMQVLQDFNINNLIIIKDFITLLILINEPKKKNK